MSTLERGPRISIVFLCHERDALHIPFDPDSPVKVEAAFGGNIEKMMLEWAMKAHYRETGHPAWGEHTGLVSSDGLYVKGLDVKEHEQTFVIAKGRMPKKKLGWCEGCGRVRFFKLTV